MESKPHSREQIISAVVRKISDSTGFPSLSASLARVMAVSDQPNATAQELAQVILQDYGLTSRILKVVNSAFYGLGKKKVSTISRAIVLLGFKTIKDIAAGMLVFEHFFKRSGRKAEMVDVITKSFLSAIQAQELAALASYPLPEEAFICALLHKLGKMVVAVYCQPEYARITALLKEGRSEYEAAREVLGVSLPEIGRSVAQRWRMPPVIWQSMDRVDGVREEIEPGKEFVKMLSSISNNCVEKLCGPDPGGWQETLAPLSKTVALSEEALVGLVKHSTDTATAISPMMTKSIRRMGLKQLVHGLTDPSAAEAEREAEEEGEEELGEAEAARDREKVLLELMADITQSLTTDCSLNQIYPMILESMYRGLGFERVVFSVLTRDRKLLQGRYGLGRDIDKFIAEFQLPFGPGARNPLTQALAANKDEIIPFEEVTDEAFRKSFAPYLAGSTLYIYPLVVRQRPIGCFFAQRREAAGQLGPGELQSLAVLRNYGVLAIQAASQHT